MSSAVKVAVVMPVYNCEAYVAEAVESILGQTFEGFELLVVDDGSSDGSSDIVGSFSDPRIRIVRQEHSGYIAALNLGLELTSAPYYARMDADDVSARERLGIQYKYMESHANVVALGTSYHEIEHGKTRAVVRCAAEPEEILERLMGHNVLANGTIMIRTEALRKVGGFDTRCEPYEDYELWERLSRAGDLACLGDDLYAYRFHGGNVSIRKRTTQILGIFGVQARFFERLCASEVPGGRKTIRSFTSVERFLCAAMRHRPNPRAVDELIKGLQASARKNFPDAWHHFKHVAQSSWCNPVGWALLALATMRRLLGDSL